MVDLDPMLNTHVIFAIAKRTTVQLGLSMKAFTYANPSGTHISNLKWRHPNVWGSDPKNQVEAVTAIFCVTDLFVKQFFIMC